MSRTVGGVEKSHLATPGVAGSDVGFGAPTRMGKALQRGNGLDQSTNNGKYRVYWGEYCTHSCLVTDGCKHIPNTRVLA